MTTQRTTRTEAAQARRDEALRIVRERLAALNANEDLNIRPLEPHS